MQIQLVSKDNHELDAYVSSPQNEEKGSIIIIQEIFGITSHIESVCQSFANEGYKTMPLPCSTVLKKILFLITARLKKVNRIKYD